MNHLSLNKEKTFWKNLHCKRKNAVRKFCSIKCPSQRSPMSELNVLMRESEGNLPSLLKLFVASWCERKIFPSVGWFFLQTLPNRNEHLHKVFETPNDPMHSWNAVLTNPAVRKIHKRYRHSCSAKKTLYCKLFTGYTQNATWRTWTHRFWKPFPRTFAQILEKSHPKSGKNSKKKVLNERFFLDSGQVKCRFVKSAGKCLLNVRKVNFFRLSFSKLQQHFAKVACSLKRPVGNLSLKVGYFRLMAQKVSIF